MFFLSSVCTLGQDTGKSAIEKVVRDSNKLEMTLYEKPTDDELLKNFKATVTEGGFRDLDVSGRVERARKAGRKALNMSFTIDKLTVREVKDDMAIVETEESGGFEWSDNASPPFSQDHKPHTYQLKKDGTGKWLIDGED